MPEISALINTVVKTAPKESLPEHTLVLVTMLPSKRPEMEFNIKKEPQKSLKGLLTLPENNLKCLNAFTMQS